MDGQYQKRIRINYLLNNQPIVIAAPNDGAHTIRLYKTTEPGHPIYISKVIGENIKSLAERRRHFIEFIGNSITCGAASDESEIPCNVGLYQDQANAYYAYGPRLARALNTDYMLSSVSGIGVYRNYQGNNGPTMTEAL